ncbi:hypothetical protein BVC80_1751g214 [Macleaya cordata]|uniref:Uncharacterized protein n=1 Tax=Macleaya cordata TaxID=56857 RepID=A0A200QHY7_MACCD|nr:hypothetical protein BVC80_1751g214 [Macleaya cordata]
MDNYFTNQTRATRVRRKTRYGPVPVIPSGMIRWVGSNLGPLKAATKRTEFIPIPSFLLQCSVLCATEYFKQGTLMEIIQQPIFCVLFFFFKRIKTHHLLLLDPSLSPPRITPLLLLPL